MHAVVERLERLMTLLVLLVLGMAMTQGLLEDLDWRGVVIALALVLVVRPLAGWVALAVLPREERSEGVLLPRGRWRSPSSVRGVAPSITCAQRHDVSHEGRLCGSSPWSTLPSP